jgi:hypothetical protein
MSVKIASDAKVAVGGDDVAAPVVAKARKARSKNGAPSRPKPTKALLSLREISHYHRLKTALKQGSRIKAPVILAEFCKPLVPIDDMDEVVEDEDASEEGTIKESK